MSGGRGPLPPAARKLLEWSRDFAERHSLEFYVVGGFVRDRLLGKTPADIDLVWVDEPPRADPAEVSAAYGRHVDSKCSFRREFLTSTCLVSGMRVDLGRARAEAYSKPAALPDVRPATLIEDLERRDFTVNAMAWPIAAALALVADDSSLIDPSGGRADLDRGIVRVLHRASFADDPTRILRGLELATRRGLGLADDTRELARASVEAGHFALVSAARVRNELARLFSTPRTVVAASRGLRDFALDRALVPGFRIDDHGLELLGRLSRRWPAELSVVPVALMLLAWSAPREVRAALAGRLDMGGRERDLLVEGPLRMQPALDRLAAVDWSAMEVAGICGDLSELESSLLDRLVDSPQAERLVEVKERLSIGLRIGGADLRAAGVAGGPAIRRALDRTLEARRAGEIDADSELDFALGWLRAEDRAEDES